MLQAVGILVTGTITALSHWGLLPATGPNAVPADSTPAPGATVRVDPASAAQGGQVRVTAFCPDDSGKVTTVGEVSSAAFTTTPLRPAPTGGGLIADVTVSATIPPGSYPVNAKCANGLNVGTILTVYAVPTKSGPPTGGGYLAERKNGPLLISGVALIGVSAGVGLFALRRRFRTAA